jgi:hypothetical protein
MTAVRLPHFARCVRPRRSSEPRALCCVCFLRERRVKRSSIWVASRMPCVVTDAVIDAPGRCVGAHLTTSCVNHHDTTASASAPGSTLAGQIGVDASFVSEVNAVIMVDSGVATD